jgi:quercetin dioxygenase-like cupin family protein
VASYHVVMRKSIKKDNMRKINIRDEIASLEAYWSQRVIAEANGQLFKVAKGIGEINWHKHDDQDELFILYKGRLTIQLRTENIELFEGEMFVIPKGVEHCAKADEEAAFVIVGLNVTSNKQGGKPDWSYTDTSLQKPL